MTTCKWHDEDGCWVSDCGVLFEFSEGSPVECGFEFCYKCGKHIEIETPALEDAIAHRCCWDLCVHSHQMEYFKRTGHHPFCKEHGEKE
jgi:hypothetical protein